MNHFLRLSGIACVLFGFLLTSESFADGPNAAAPAATGQAVNGQAAKGQAAADAGRQADLEKDVTQGTLRVVTKDGGVVECPLKHTDVNADVSGFITRVHVTQTFANPTNERIEAVYVFPLPHEAAVDAMTMSVGDRRIVGLIKRRIEARQIYEQALMAGNTAALLEQERPNIFTQSVGNIEPGKEVRIEISYVDVLRYDMGTYEFQFPMVVGPRYNPGNPISSPQDIPTNLQGKVSPPVTDTDRVPDAQRISPPVLKPGVRNGHDISLTMTVNAGVAIQNLTVANHRAEVTRDGDQKARIVLAADDSLPNKDFVVRYSVVGKEPSMALLAHTGNYSGDARTVGNGYFMLMIQPRDDERLRKSPPREIVFLVDVSGSMSGAPTAKVVETMQQMLKLCREQDTVQVITFASQAQKLFERPVPVNEQNIGLALNFTSGLRGSGGTEMLKGVRMAIDEPIDAKRLRIVVMLTDGYIGNEAEIIEHVGKNCGDHVRFWCVGIGQSPNMFLVDGVAKQGGGMGKHLGLNDDSVSLSQEIMTRIQRAQLANVKIDWGSNRVAETYPVRIPELWAGRPIIVFGRYRDGGQPGTIRVNGTIEGEPASWTLEVSLPANEAAHNVLASVWARRKVEDLMQQAFYQNEPSVEEEVTAIALDYRLMSQYTSFVAVDEKDAAKAAPTAMPPRRMLVPVPLPEGTRWEGFFGGGDRQEEAEVAGLSVEFGRFSRLHETREALLPSANPAPVALGEPRYEQSGGAQFGPGRRIESPVYRRSVVDRSPQKKTKLAAAPAVRGLATGGLGGEPFGGRVDSLARGRTNNNEAKALMKLSVVAESDALKDIGDIDGRNAVSSPASIILQTQAKELLQAAQETLKAAREKQSQNDLATARRLFIIAYLQGNASTNCGVYDGGIAGQALEALEEVRVAQLQNWAKKLPVLDKRLDLVIRDKSLSEAITEVAKAAGVAVDVVPGSVEDSATLLERSERVTYMNLRHATLAEALDWICIPARMTWRPSDSGILVGTDRRLDGESGWVYDVSEIASPTTEELSTLADDSLKQAAVNKSIHEFLALVREKDRAGNGPKVAWYAPNQLLVVGSIAEHANVARLVASLADPTAKLNGAAAQLHATTVKRAEQRKENRNKRLSALAALDVAAVHDTFTWRLLSGALAGRVDDEALTELRIAWSRPETDSLLKGDHTALILRSAWIIQEAARLVEDHAELAELSALVRQKSRPAAEAAVTKLETRSTEAGVMADALYASLSQRGDAILVGKSQSICERLKNDTSHPIARLAIALLTPDAPESRKALVEWCATGVQGPDTLVLLALACRKAGPETWEEFRLRSQDLLGSQPLPGDVVVLVNRLNSVELARLTQK